MKISVIAASRYGSTLEVGRFTSDRPTSHGHEAIRVEAGESQQPPGSEAAVFGSPLYLGRWLKPARRMAERLGSSEERRPILAFTCGPVGNPPKPEAPALEELFPALAAKALRHRVFAGRLDFSALSRREPMDVRAVKSPEGDCSDFSAIGEFSDDVSATLIQLRPAFAAAAAGSLV